MINVISFIIVGKVEIWWCLPVTYKPDGVFPDKKPVKVEEQKSFKPEYEDKSFKKSEELEDKSNKKVAKKKATKKK